VINGVARRAQPQAAKRQFVWSPVCVKRESIMNYDMRSKD
jgi:hypothetical protein